MTGGVCDEIVVAVVGGVGRADVADVVREVGEGEAARDGGRETGSKENFSMRRAWQVPDGRAMDRLRRSSAANVGQASVGSLCWGRSVKRTEGGWACGAAMMAGQHAIGVGGSVRESESESERAYIYIYVCV